MLCDIFFFSLGSSGCEVDRAAQPVAAISLVLFQSLVMMRGTADVWRVWADLSVTAVVTVTMDSMAVVAKVSQQKT